jgi:hypothetical protein
MTQRCDDPPMRWVVLVGKLLAQILGDWDSTDVAHTTQLMDIAFRVNPRPTWYRNLVGRLYVIEGITALGLMTDSGPAVYRVCWRRRRHWKLGPGTQVVMGCPCTRGQADAWAKSMQRWGAWVVLAA